MKSLSETVSVVGCSASVGTPPRTPGNVRATPSIASLLIRPRKQSTIRRFEQEIRNQSDDTDDDDAEDDLTRIEQRLAVRDHVSNAA